MGDRRRGWLTAWAVRAATCLLVLAVVCQDRSARADLTHLYTFNDGTAHDSVGTADGTLFGAATVDVDGVLQLPGGAADYVSLDGPAIGINSYVDATFEAWFTSTQLSTWQRVFDFGDRTVPAAEQGYVYYTPQGGNGGGLGVYATFGQRTEAPHETLTTNHLYHLAMVIDDSANGGSDLMSIYLDGQFKTSVGHSRSLADVGTTFAYLGKSQIAVDPNFQGGLDEFRIYDHALSLSEVEQDFAAGPTSPPTLRLDVNTVTGSVTIVGPDMGSVPFDYYRISSGAGALDEAGWSSLDDQDLDSIGSGAGESWEEAESNDATKLTELFLLGGSTVASGGRLELGHALNLGQFGPGTDADLEFRYGRKGGSQLQMGEVVYVTPEPLDGDYNHNGKVDAADYTLWRNSLGSTTDLDADGDHDLRVDEDDYAIWKWTFGNEAPSAAAALGVPEPSSTILVFWAVAGGLSGQGWRRR